MDIKKTQQVIEVKPEDNTITIDIPDLPLIPNWGSFTLVGTFVLGAFWKYMLSPRIKKWNSSLSRSLEVDKLLDIVLGEILNEADADRVLLVEPHNGTVFVSGRHDYKLTCTVEAVKAGVQPSKAYIRSIPVREVREPLTKVIEKGSYAYEGDNSTLTPYTEDLYVRGGVEESITYCIYKEEKQVLAFLSISWLTKGNLQKIDSHKMDKLLAKAKSYLNLYKENTFAKIIHFLKGG